MTVRTGYAGNLIGKFTLMLYRMVVLVVVLNYFFCCCFELGFYLLWDASRMQRLYPREC